MWSPRPLLNGPLPEQGFSLFCLLWSIHSSRAEQRWGWGGCRQPLNQGLDADLGRVSGGWRWDHRAAGRPSSRSRWNPQTSVGIRFCCNLCVFPVLSRWGGGRGLTSAPPGWPRARVGGGADGTPRGTGGTLFGSSTLKNRDLPVSLASPLLGAPALQPDWRPTAWTPREPTILPEQGWGPRVWGEQAPLTLWTGAGPAPVASRC